MRGPEELHANCQKIEAILAGVPAADDEARRLKMAGILASVIMVMGLHDLVEECLDYIVDGLPDRKLQ